MENKLKVAQEFVNNSIPNQELSYANQLTVKQWNDIINVLRVQTNTTTNYLRQLHSWLIGINNTEDYAVVEDGLNLYSWIKQTLDSFTSDLFNTLNSKYVTLDTEQRISSDKIFDKNIILSGPENLIYPSTNNSSLIGTPSKHFKQGYINDLRSLLILPIPLSSEESVNNTGSIGSTLYAWDTAYINNVYSKVLYENGKPLSEIYLKEHQPINHLATKVELEEHKNDFDNPHRVTKEQLGLGDLDSTLEALEDKIDELIQNDDTLQSALANYYTKVQTLDLLGAKADITYVNEKIAALVAEELDSNPETLNTLRELSTALGNDENFATTVANQIGLKADKTDLNAHINDKNNPHEVKIEQIEGLEERLNGLGEDGDSTGEALNEHILDKNNPHEVKIDQIPGLREELDDKFNVEDLDLSNYYTKDETYNKDEVDNMLENLGNRFSSYYTAGEGIHISNDGVISLSVEFAEEGSY